MPNGHPLHPISVHLPLACLIFTPLSDVAAALTGTQSFWFVSSLASAGVVLFGLAAATLGALDFEKAHAISARTVILHASLMASAVLVEAIGFALRVTPNMDIVTPAPVIAMSAGGLALFLGALGGYFGGELVYRHGVNVATVQKQ